MVSLSQRTVTKRPPFPIRLNDLPGSCSKHLNVCLNGKPLAQGASGVSASAACGSQSAVAHPGEHIDLIVRRCAQFPWCIGPSSRASLALIDPGDGVTSSCFWNALHPRRSEGLGRYGKKQNLRAYFIALSPDKNNWYLSCECR